MGNLLDYLKRRKVKKAIFYAVILLILGGIAYLVFKPEGERSSAQTVSSGKEVKPKASASVNRDFEFMAVNAKKEELPIGFTITNIERKDSIKLKGEAIRPSDGHDFLLVRVELTNDHPQRVAIATADRVRIEGEEGKLFAPDYHNGNVVIDPISVRKDVLAFIVDAGDKSFSFLVGELTGDKQRIEIKF